MNTFVERLGWVLVHSLWQFAAVALLAAVARQAMRHRSATVRYCVFVIAMALMISAPVATWILSNDSPRELASRRALAPGQSADIEHSLVTNVHRLASEKSEISETNSERDRRTGGVSPLVQTPLDVASTRGLTPPVRQGMSWSQWTQTALRPWLTWIVAAWSLGVVICSLRPLFGWHTLWRLKRVGVSPVSDDITTMLRLVAERLGVRRAVQVLQSTLAQVPVVVGYFRPVILLPLSLMTSLPAEQLEAILAHELAHVRRHDFVVNLLQTLVETIFFYHPAVWWLSHQIRIEREHCCDDLVIASLGNRVEYGLALLAIEELRGRSTVLALGANDSSLLSRIRRIVGFGSEQTANERSSPVSIGLMLSAVLCALALTCFAMRPGSAKPESANPLVVTLPGGLEVELLGVTNYFDLFPSEPNSSSVVPNPWWRPDGERLEQWPVKRFSFPKPLDQKEKQHYRNWSSVAVRIRGSKEGEVEAWVVIDGARGSTTASGGDSANGAIVRESLMSAGPLPGIKSGIVRVACGVGERGPWQRVYPNQTKEVDGPIPADLEASYADMADVTFREVNGQTRLVTHPMDVSEVRASTEMDLIDVDGQPVKGATAAVVDGSYGWTYPVPLARVSHYRYRLRPNRHWVTFENVSFQPGHKTEVKSSVGTTPQPRRDPITADLPNGIKVEFVGLAPMEAEPKTWWKPDGSPLNELPRHDQSTARVTQTFPRFSEYEMRRVVLRVHGLPNASDITAMGLSSFSRWNEAHDSGGSFVRVDGDYAIRPGRKTAKIDVGIATQPQSALRMLDPSGVKLPRPVDAPADPLAEDIEIVSVNRAKSVNTERGEQTWITWISSVERGRLIDLDLKLIDEDGKSHDHKQTHTNGDAMPRQHVTYAFDVPFDRVARFEYRLRVFRHWVTFDNVALNPGEMTDVKVSVESISSAPSHLRLLEVDGSPAQSNHVVLASVGFPGKSGRVWFESANNDGLISLEKLPAGTHWLAAAGDSHLRTVFPLRVPTEQAVVEQRLRNARSFVDEENVVAAASVQGDSPDDEVIEISIRNESAETTWYSAEDISFTMFPSWYRIYAPRSRVATKPEDRDIELPPGRSAGFRIKWHDLVRNGMWASRGGEIIDEPWSGESRPGKIQIAVHLGNRGIGGGFVTEPQTILDRPIPLSAEERINKALDQPVTLMITDTSWSDVIADISKQYRVPFIIDASENISLDKKISLDVRDVKLREVLGQLLEQVGSKTLGFVVENELVKIMAAAKLTEGSGQKDAGQDTDVSNALRCRLFVIPATANDERPDNTKTANSFARGEDVTFAVELQNVSDRPRTLIGVRHDTKGQPAFDGKLAPEFFSPHLFEFEFTDANGQPVPRTPRAFLEMPHLLNGASTHSIDPGKSLVVVLRPARFHAPMDHRLPPGTYRAKVRYHGPSDPDLAYFRAHRSNELRAKAWFGDVRSNEVTFTVANDPSTPNPPKLVWGPVKDGLQAAVEFRQPPGAPPTNDPPGTFPTKPYVATIFHVKNVSDHTIKFVSETGRQGDAGTATDEAGKTIKLESAWFSGWPVLVRWTLKPGEVAELAALTSGISLLKKPGKYAVRYEINFGSLSRNNGKGADGFPKEDDWHQVLPTGETPITIRARPPVVIPVSANGEIRGVLLDAATGEPVEGAKVACGALINPSGQRLGSSAVTDDEGRYRLHVPSPGFFNVWLHEYAKSEWMTAAADDGLLVEAGKATVSQMFLVNARKIAGTLVSNGMPVEYPVVKCNSPARPESLGVEYFHKMRTKTDGSFWFAVPPGRVHLYVDEESRQTKDSSTGRFHSAHAHVEVPSTSDPAPVTLTLQAATKHSDTEWLKRSTPGTRIARREGNQNITGTVVDESGIPLAGAKLLRDDGAITSSNDKGEFRVETPKGVHLTIHAVAPGYHVWFGRPTSGDVLKIVLEQKQRPLVATTPVASAQSPTEAVPIPMNNVGPKANDLSKPAVSRTVSVRGVVHAAATRSASAVSHASPH